MVAQLVLGTLLVLTSTLAAGASFLLLEEITLRTRPWFVRPPHALRMLVLLQLVMVCILAVVSFAVWIWALAFWVLDCFPTLEESLYFSLVAFTTLGFGDLLLPDRWRLLAGFSAVNGLLMIGLLGAVLVETLRRVRLVQYGKDDPYE